MIGTDYETYNDDMYFAEENDAKKFASACFARMDSWIEFCENGGLADRWTQNQFLYQGVDPKMTDDGYYNSQSFRITGENGEMLQVTYNDYRNILQHILNMTVSQPPNMQAQAINDDSASLVAAQTFDGLFDYYMKKYRSGRLLRQSRLAVEGCLYQDIGSVLCEWDEFAGKIIGDQNGQLVTEGDLYFKFRSVWDVFYDPGVEEEDECDWVIVRDQVNKFEYARRYPKFADRIKNTSRGNANLYSWRRGFNRPQKTDMIDVYKFYHRPTVALPQGRYALLLDAETVLNEQYQAPSLEASQSATLTDAPLQSEAGPSSSFVPNPYDCLPLFSVRAMEQQGGVLGYAPGNVLAPVQISQNILSSAMMTNFAMFGVQNIGVKDGDSFDVESIAGGMNIVKYIEQPPVPLQLTAQANGIMEFYETLDNKGEILGGINSVVRGDPETSLKSGKALGIIQAQAVQFQSALSASYAQFLENIGNFMLQVFRKYVKAPRVVQIVGKNAVSQAQNWSAETFGPIDRVAAELVDPAMRTLGFKTDLADKLLANGMMQTPQELITVITTGQIKPAIRGPETELNLIHQENEDMLAGAKQIEQQIQQIRATFPQEQAGPMILQLAASVMPPVLDDDDDAMHMQEHKAVTASPAVRRNGAVVAIAMAHKQAHQQNAMRKAQQQLQQQAQVQAVLAPPPPASAQKQPPEGQKQPSQSETPAGNT